MRIEITLIVALGCLLFEAFCSGSEMAVVSVDRIGLRSRAAAGSTRARLLEWFLDKPQRLLATTLVGTSLSVVVSTVTVTATLMDRFPRGGEFYSVAIMSPILLIFGETVPKTLARRYAETIGPAVAYPLRVLSLLFFLPVLLLGLITHTVTRLLGIAEERALVTREELEALLRSPASSTMSDPERRMVQRIFRFGAATVYDLMVPLSSVLALDEEASLDDACREVRETNHSRIPIYRERVDQIVGVVHSFDILKTGARAGRVSEVARSPIYVPESALAADVMRLLQKERQGMAVVVDEYGGATGVVTVEDILEELVGEIEDEHDLGADPSIRQESPGTFRVAGRAALSKVNAQLRIHLPDGENYETIGGLLLDRMKRIPREGETITIAGTLLTVLSASERAVQEVRIHVVKK